MRKDQLGFELCRSIGMLTLPYLKLADAYLLFGLGVCCCCYVFSGVFSCFGFFFLFGDVGKSGVKDSKINVSQSSKSTS